MTDKATDNSPSSTEKKSRKKVRTVLGFVLITMMLIGLGATYWLTQQNQDIRQQASSDPYCSTGTCVSGISSCDSIGMVGGSGSCSGGICCERDTSSCGDGHCSGGETQYNCPQDCSSSSECSTGTCVNGVSSCTSIGMIDGNGSCSGGICCEVDTSTCGDSQCNGGETRYNCPQDCDPDFCGPGEIVIDGECKDADKFQCDKNDPSACGGQPWRCHCQGGDACTGTKCEDIKTSCENQGRSYCTNHQGFGMTCCFPGYSCCPNGDGCCQGTPPPTNPPSPTPPTSPSPTPSTSPSPTPPVGPQCLDITMNVNDPQIGDDVTFTCGQVTEAISYVFRVMDPDGMISSLAAIGNVSETYTIETDGKYYAQCQICYESPAITDDLICTPWEPLPTQQGN